MSSNSSVDTDAVPSVRARLAEIKMLEAASKPPPPARPSPAPQRPRRQQPPPPPPRPPLPTRHPTAPPAPDRRAVVPPPVLPPRPQPASRITSTGRILKPSFPTIDPSPMDRKLPPPVTAPLDPPPDAVRRTTLAVPPPRAKPPPPLPTRRLPPPPSATPRVVPPLPSRPHSSTASTTSTTSSDNDTCLRCRSFTAVDAHAATLPRTHYTSVRALSHDLTAPFPSATDKARAIFTWLHHNISYNASGFFSGNRGAQDPATVLRTGLSVCQGYAELYAALAHDAGVYAELVSGHGKGYGYKRGEKLKWPPDGHAWNAVRLDGGTWWLLDACWGAGHISEGQYVRKFNAEMFVATPEEFARKHYAADERWNLGGVGWEQYERGEEEGATMFTRGEEVQYLGREVWPREKKLRAGRQSFGITVGSCEHTPPPREEGTFPLFLNVGDGIEMANTHMLQRSPDGKSYSVTVDVPSGCRIVKLHYGTTMNGRSAKGLGPEEWKRGLGRSAWGASGLVQWGG